MVWGLMVVLVVLVVRRTTMALGWCGPVWVVPVVWVRRVLVVPADLVVRRRWITARPRRMRWVRLVVLAVRVRRLVALVVMVAERLCWVRGMRTVPTGLTVPMGPVAGVVVPVAR